uniref:small monomeric GTPase n=1 Tax=Mastacembelus armatus TaxID=205130 RepID=A0A3Q3LK21_9TELE
MKTLNTDGIKVRVQIWDTAGQECYQTIPKQFLAQGIVFVYDVTNPSFQRIAKWASDVGDPFVCSVTYLAATTAAPGQTQRKVCLLHEMIRPHLLLPHCH